MPTTPADRKLPPGIKVVTKRQPDGTVKRYCYGRLPGGKLAPLLHPRTRERLDETAPLPMLEAALRQARRQTPRPTARAGMTTLVIDYRKSPEYRRLAKSTSIRYGRVLDQIADRFGWMTIDDLGRRRARDDFYGWRDEMAETPAAADQAVDVLCALLGWSYRRGRIEVNHAHGIDPLRAPGKHRRDKVWTPALEKRLLAVACPEVFTAYLFARYTVLRQADCCAVEWGTHFDGEWIEIMPQKTIRRQIKVFIPVFALPPLAELVATLAKEGHLLRSPSGRAVNPPNLRARFGADMEKAGLGELDLHFHDLRGTGINDMLNAGATNAEVASISGHVIAEGGHGGLGAYAERSRTQALGAFRKWAAALADEPKVIPFPARG